MLDLHAVTGTPGAGIALGNVFAGIAVNDGATNAGIPITNNAILEAWGGISPTADTIGALKLSDLDQVDPVNGEYLTPGTGSLLNIVHEWTNLPYKGGPRNIQMGTNTGTATAVGYTIDVYPGGKVISAKQNIGNQVTPAAITYGSALTTVQWGSTPFSPPNALKSGSYAILGARVSGISNAALIRFQHPDFGQYLPGFPVANEVIISSSSWDKVDKDALVLSEAGNQFVYLSDILGTNCVPVFSVTNAGTGLNIQMLDVEADAPIVTLELAKVG